MARHMNRPTAVLVLLVTASVLAQPARGQVAAADSAGRPPQRPVALLCGTGPSPHYETVIGGMLDFFGENKAAVTETDGHAFTRTGCLEKREASGASSLLYLTVSPSEKYAYESTFTVVCLDASGTKLWEERVRGPVMSSSVTSTMEKLAKNMGKKLKQRVGRPGLPLKT